MRWKEYKIKEGRHRSRFFDFIPHFGKKYIAKDVIFKDTCLYNFGTVDQFDVNKLFGLSLGLHHKNSARFGWRPSDTLKGGIEISAYTYLNGERFYMPLASIKTNEQYCMELTVAPGFYKFKITNSSNVIICDQKISRPEAIRWGYLLFPYFGGNRTAPRTLSIMLGELGT